MPGLVLDASTPAIQALVRCCYPLDGATATVSCDPSGGGADDKGAPCVPGCYAPGEAAWDIVGGPVASRARPLRGGIIPSAKGARGWCVADEGVLQRTSCAWRPRDLQQCLQAQVGLLDLPTARANQYDSPSPVFAGSLTLSAFGARPTLNCGGGEFREHLLHNELVLDVSRGLDLEALLLAVLTFDNASDTLAPRLARQLGKPLLLYDRAAALGVGDGEPFRVA